MPSPVANSRFFSAHHLRACGIDAPASLSELAVHCLELVAELSRAGLRYQFKGGNSLLLILPRPLRFSIDVDIATDEPRERIEACLDDIIARFGVFTRWESRQHKTKPWIPLASYYLFFPSALERGMEKSIMLDAQLRRSPYPTEMKRIRCLDVFTADQTCELPLPASIIGDKLLTLGPSTLGIPVGKGKEAQRLKHAFDISALLATGPSLDGIRDSFTACLRHELEIQQRSMAVDTVVNDTLAYCATTLAYPQLPAPDLAMAPALAENIRGLEAFRGYLFSRDYTWQRLRRDMARVALCMAGAGFPQVGARQFDAVLQQVNALAGDEAAAAACWKAVAQWAAPGALPKEAVAYAGRG